MTIFRKGEHRPSVQLPQQWPVALLCHAGVMDEVRPSLELTSVTASMPAPRDSAASYSRLFGVDITASEPARPGKPPEDGWAQLKTERVTLNFEYEESWVRRCGRAKSVSRQPRST